MAGQGLQATLDQLAVAYERAEALFVEHLSPEQRQSFNISRRVKVGDWTLDTRQYGHNGYRVFSHRARYCLVPRDERYIFIAPNVTVGYCCEACSREYGNIKNWALGPDVWLTILLWLTYNEDEFLRVAVRV